MRWDEMMERTFKVEEVEQKEGGRCFFFPVARRVCLKCRPVIATGSWGNQRAKESKKVKGWKETEGEPAVPPGRPHYVTRVLWSANKPIMFKKTPAVTVGSTSVKAQLKCSKSKKESVWKAPRLRFHAALQNFRPSSNSRNWEIIVDNLLDLCLSLLIGSIKGTFCRSNAQPSLFDDQPDK